MAPSREGNPCYKLQLEAEGPRVALALESRKPGVLVAKDDRRGKEGLSLFWEMSTFFSSFNLSGSLNANYTH